MAHYVISDIHGEGERFYAMLEKIGFSDADTLYILGDVIDRGPDGIRLLLDIMDRPNMIMLLGNHEHMMLQYFRSGATELDVRRWSRNGNAPTLASWLKLTPEEQGDILFFLRSRDSYLEISVGNRRYHLVHGFPGDTLHDRVWNRPEHDTPNPVPGCELIIGHTPVLSLLAQKEARMEKLMEMLDRGEYLKILRTPGFTDIDCGCGHSYPIARLACLRLEDLAEFYT